MSWNYRIMAHLHDDTVYFNVHEVYYNKKGKPTSYTSTAVTVGGETVDELQQVLTRMTIGTGKPVLWAGEKFPKEYKPKK